MAESPDEALFAICGCGALSVELPGYTESVVACYCRDCQSRTGSPLGVGAYYPAEQLTISGEYREYTRPTSTGGKFTSCFCPECGSSVFWRADKHPTMIGVAVGCISDIAFPAPARAVWEQSKRHWIELPAVDDHYTRART